MNINDNKIQTIGEVLNNSKLPLKQRFRALFTLKNLGGEIAIQSISECFKDDSALLKHELAYCLGQMQDKRSIPILVKILEDKSQEPMVRHEAAEALGAIGSLDVKGILEKYKDDPCIEVKETCLIALDRLDYINDKNSKNNKINSEKSPYASIDPSPPIEENQITLDKLRGIYLNENETLFNRYRAMFSLRNLNTRESVLLLGEGLNDKSALFRHEVAFVLGQLQKEWAIPFLVKNLKDPMENEMVRHECAEALGAIATEECMEILQVYLKDNERVVKESCEVALDMCEYENNDEFQYADTLTKI